MAYVDNSFYNDVYCGTIIVDSTELFEKLAQAETLIDRATYGRIEPDMSNLTDHQKLMVKLATCYEADHLAKYGDMIFSPFSSFSVGGISIGKNDGIEITAKIDTYAKMLLDRSGLTCTQI